MEAENRGASIRTSSLIVPRKHGHRAAYPELGDRRGTDAVSTHRELLTESALELAKMLEHNGEKTVIRDTSYARTWSEGG